MGTVIVGAGPTGLFTAIALSRRGRPVVVVDRDPGPGDTGAWRRRGVMQFDHAHTFRGPVVEALQFEIPDALRALRHAGATIATAADGSPVALRCRRVIFERVLREVAAREPKLTLITGHVDGVVQEKGRAVGVDIGGRHLTAELVIDASGRAGRVMRDVRGTGEGGPCGASYVSRQYRLRDAAAAGPINSPIGLSLALDGYFAVMFQHDSRTFSITITHGGTDPRMFHLRHPRIFESAIGAIPLLADWTGPDRARPLTEVLPGGRLYNSYRGQLDDTGRPALPGLIAVGDSVCTTTPLAGRGVALAFLQAQTLVRMLTDRRSDGDRVTVEFDEWCRNHVRPWFIDHLHCDRDRLRRWAGGDVDLGRPLPSDLVTAAAQVDHTLREAVHPYERMLALPCSLDRLQGRAHAVFASGWRPTPAAGPTRDELGQLCEELASRRDDLAASQS